jgi:hypothetical protein
VDEYRFSLIETVKPFEEVDAAQGDPLHCIACGARIRDSGEELREHHPVSKIGWVGTTGLPAARGVAEPIVVNTGPLVSFAKIGCLDLIGRLPYEFLSPAEVWQELDEGRAVGHPHREGDRRRDLVQPRARQELPGGRWRMNKKGSPARPTSK